MELPAQLEPTHAWREIRSELRRKVGESTYEIWLAPLELQSWDGRVLRLQAPAALQTWVAKRFGRILQSSTQAHFGPDAEVSLATGDEPRPAPAPGAASARHHSVNWLNPRYSFGQFVIGEGNRLAHAASLAVAELPGQAYNPLFLHAPPGLGKTHLLHAIGNYVSQFGDGSRVRYTTVEDFTNHFIAAIGARSLEPFKRLYRDADVLLIDDVQFLASKAKTEEEFFHTFNALHEGGRQLVLTCDRLPSQLRGVESRLRERFEAGLVAEIRPPDLATRLTILRKRAVLDRVDIADPAVLELIAERITDNVRALEGALIRLVAHHSLTGRPIDCELATSVLGLDALARCPALSTETIQRTVASHYGITVEELTSASRQARVAWPRQVAIHLCRELTDTPLQDIGRVFGGRNHATVLHACRRVAGRAREDVDISRELDELSEALSSAPAPDRTR